jgi:predicted Zn finger-like uncharacterized protein
MIISCNNCNKKFEINSDLIPSSGRLLMCSNCKSQWFYKKKVPIDKPVIEVKKIKNDISKNNLDNSNNGNDLLKEKILRKESSNNILYKILVFIISITALIILADTFRPLITIFIPNFEFIIYNLFESIKDIILFIKDLLK